jgi:hypothetical protein
MLTRERLVDQRGAAETGADQEYEHARYLHEGCGGVIRQTS